MLQTIRDKLSGWVARVVLGSLAVVFVFWGIELRSAYSVNNYAASVNGDKISLNEAQRAWQQQQVQLTQMFKGDVPEAFKKQQQQVVLDRLIREQLLQQQVNKLGYGVSDDALIDALHEVNEFKVDGKFNVDRYVAAVRSIGKTKSQFEAEYRDELVLKQLQNAIANTSFSTPAESQRAQALLNEQREVDYATIPAKSFLSTVNVTDAEVQAYYDANKNAYLTPETVALQYVELKLVDAAAEVAVTDEALRAHYEQIKDRFSTAERRRGHHILIAAGNGVDDATAKKQAEDALAKLNSGADFETLARQISKDPGSAAKGGDLGWATRGMFVGPFEDALFSMKPGEIRGPIKTEFGYHIIRLDEVEGGGGKPFEQVRAEVESDYKTEQARSLFYDKTQKLADAAFAKLTELDSVAKEFNTTVKTVPDFTRNGGGEFGKESPVIDAAFSEAVLEKGQNSPLVTIGEDRALVVRIADHKLPEQRPLDQVRAEIVAQLKDNAAKAALAQKSAEIVKQLQDGSLQWSAAVKQLAVTPAGKKMLGRNAPGVAAPIIKTAFDLSKNDVLAKQAAFGATPLDNGDYAIIAVTAVQPGTAVADAASNLATVQSQQASQLGRVEFNDYVQELQRTAKIEKNAAAFE